MISQEKNLPPERFTINVDLSINNKGRPHPICFYSNENSICESIGNSSPTEMNSRFWMSVFGDWESIDPTVEETIIHGLVRGEIIIGY